MQLMRLFTAQNVRLNAVNNRKDFPNVDTVSVVLSFHRPSHHRLSLSDIMEEEEDHGGEVCWCESNIQSIQRHLRKVFPTSSTSQLERNLDALRGFFHENRTLAEASYHSNESGIGYIPRSLDSSNCPVEVCSKNYNGESRALPPKTGGNVYMNHSVSLVEPNQPRTDELCDADVSGILDYFPFHLVVDKRANVTRVGRDLQYHLPSESSTGFQSFDHLFRLIYPVKTLSEVFHILDPIKPLTTKLELRSTHRTRRKGGRELVLKGEIYLLEDSYSLLFLLFPLKPDVVMRMNLGQNLVPLIRSLADLTNRTRLESQSKARLKALVDDLEDERSRLKAERAKIDDILRSVFPSSVMENLRIGRTVEPKTFHLVTILFADIVQFTALCGDVNVTPMDVVRMLNHLYTKFDLLSSLNGVYKVETIGDAYMVVGGFPVFSSSHADVTILMAFEMIRASETVNSPVNHQPIQIRTGVHSGPCVSGVVGHLMPRYCLFGRTVALASKMETYSGPGQINISEDTQRCLLNPEVYQFEENTGLPEDIPLRSFFISRTPSSPVLHSLDLPVPRGMFRTPHPSPHSSPARHSPCETASSNDSLFRFPVVDTLDDAGLSFEIAADSLSSGSPVLPSSALSSPSRLLSVNGQSSGEVLNSYSPRNQAISNGKSFVDVLESRLHLNSTAGSSDLGNEDLPQTEHDLKNVDPFNWRLCDSERYYGCLRTRLGSSRSPTSPQMQRSRRTPEILLNGLPLKSDKIGCIWHESFDVRSRNGFSDVANNTVPLRTSSTWPLCACKRFACHLPHNTIETSWSEPCDQ